MPPKSDIDYITEFLNNHDAAGYAKTVRELAEENERLRKSLDGIAVAAGDAADDFRSIGQAAAATFARSVAKVTNDALAT